MPSLFRFLMVAGVLGSLVCGGLYVLATHYEPQTEEVTKVVPGVKIRKQ